MLSQFKRHKCPNLYNMCYFRKKTLNNTLKRKLLINAINMKHLPNLTITAADTRIDYAIDSKYVSVQLGYQ